MSNFRGLYDVRAAKNSDYNFVIATFLRGLYFGDSWFSLVPKTIFMANYHTVAHNLLNHPKTVVLIACLKEDPDVVLGYSILSSDLQNVHWVYVKSAWRKQGIGAELIPASVANITHLSTLGKSLMVKRPNMIFDPFKINQ